MAKSKGNLRILKPKNKTFDNMNLVDKINISVHFVIMSLEIQRNIQTLYLRRFKGRHVEEETITYWANKIKSMAYTLETFCDELGIHPTEMLSYHSLGISEWNHIAKLCDPALGEIDLDHDYYGQLIETLTYC